MGKLAAALVALLSLAGAVTAACADDDDAPAGKGARAHAEDKYKVDTEHVFGFNEGGDIGEAGDKELEKESAARFGKRKGSYAADSTLFDFKYVPVDRVLVSPGILMSAHSISGAPDLADRQQWAFQGLWFEFKYQFLDRNRAPFGLTVFASPRWTRIDEKSGERVSQYSSEFTLALDKEIVANRLYGVVNVTYEPEVSRSHETGERERESTLGIGGGLAYQVLPGMLFGAEARYLQNHEGLIPNARKGEALYLGPTFHFRPTANTFMSVAWNAQVAGHAVGESGRLDLTNFERHQVRLRIGYEF